MKKILKITGYTIGIIILIVVFYRLFFSIYVIGSDSMEPTIDIGDLIVVSKLHYKFFEPKKNDIVLFQPIGGIFDKGPWAHRIIATEGDLISIKNNSVSVNGSKTSFSDTLFRDAETSIEKGFVAQKGDTKNSILGLVSKEKIIGKVIFSF